MIYSAVVTFTGSPIQLTSVLADTSGRPIPANTQVWRLEAEPLRANAAACYIGTANVTSTGTAGVIQELATPAASVPLDRFILQGPALRSVDPSELYCNGTAGQKLKISVWSV